MADRSWVLAAGGFFFRHRNRVFPLLLAGLCIALPPRLAGGSLATDRWIDLLGLLVVLAGQALRAAVIGLAYIKRGGLNKRVHASSLVTGGMFGVCRNPLYLGNGLIVAGLLVIHGNPWAGLLGALVFGFAYYSIVATEEAYLSERFGDEYRAYCRAVPRWRPDFGRLAEARRGMEYDWRRVVANDYGTLFTSLAAASALFVYESVHALGFAASLPRLLGCGVLVVAVGGLALAVRHLKKSGRLQLARG